MTEEDVGGAVISCLGVRVKGMNQTTPSSATSGDVLVPLSDDPHKALNLCLSHFQ